MPTPSNGTLCLRVRGMHFHLPCFLPALALALAAGDDTVRRVAEIFLILNVVYFVICVVLTIFVAFLLRAAAKIVTTYEIRQGFLVYSTFLHTALGCAFLYLGGVGLIFKDSQAKLVPLDAVVGRR